MPLLNYTTILQGTYQDTEAVPPRHRVSRPWAIFVCTMLVTFVCLLLCMRLVVPWWQGVQDHWQYGQNRITQMDADVGHGGLCHFIAEYYKGAIMVIEIPFAHTNSTRTYIIPGEADGTVPPVIVLSVVKDAQTGRADLLVRAEGTGFEMVLYNTGTSFTTRAE